ncbi:MAG: ABC transporter permease [Bacteroidales bacterium]|nr:ABC transporter permease [Bacteroidales bacterium]
MMPTLTLALKDLRLLLRDSRSAVILLVMPLLLILILGLSIGSLFEQKPDDRIRVSVVNLDAGLSESHTGFPPKPWSQMVLDDLTNTGNVRVELIPTREEAERLIRKGDRAAVVVFEPQFSDFVQRCSFVGEPFTHDPINPLYRDGILTREIGVTILRNPSQLVAYSVINQVVQVTLMRVVIPWMIGRAFEMIGTPPFMDRMEQYIPALKGAYLIISKQTIGEGIQKGIGGFFSKYDFTGKTWAKLTKSEEPPAIAENRSAYEAPDGSVRLNRGAMRYQVLVPAYTVTFAFFLVLTVGWLFVAERRHGTLIRLRAAPLTRWQILLGKLLPCLAVSLAQGFLLLLCGNLIFGMSFGPAPWLLLPVVVCTSCAAVGLAMLVAGMARTETQVAVYGTLLVLMLAGLSGSMMPRDLMPETMRQISRVTPHAWALEAYGQLLPPPAEPGQPPAPPPDTVDVLRDCGVLAGFGAVFLGLAWWRMRLD